MSAPIFVSAGLAALAATPAVSPGVPSAPEAHATPRRPHGVCNGPVVRLTLRPKEVP